MWTVHFSFLGCKLWWHTQTVIAYIGSCEMDLLPYALVYWFIIAVQVLHTSIKFEVHVWHLVKKIVF